MSAVPLSAPDRREPADTESADAQFVPNDGRRVKAATLKAWRRIVGRRGYEGHLTLDEAGCDSLRFLEFAMVLERELGRPVPLDLIDTQMRLSDIVAALSRVTPGPARQNTRPTVFLLPGLDDDEQRLARFRVALRAQVRFELVAYPDWPEMMRPGWCLADLADAVTDQIIQRSGGAPILLTGYSFGGEVGFEVACRLVRRGHPLRWFGILDADITRLPPPPGSGIVSKLRRYAIEIARDVRREGLNKSAGLLIAKLGRDVIGLPRMARAGRWLHYLPPRTEFWFHRRTRSILRIRAIWAWQDAGVAHRLDIPVTLFASEAGNGVSPPDRGWGALCSALTVVPVEGDHHTLFDLPHREVLYARYAEALQAFATDTNTEAR